MKKAPLNTCRTAVILHTRRCNRLMKWLTNSLSFHQRYVLNYTDAEHLRLMVRYFCEVEDGLIELVAKSCATFGTDIVDALDEWERKEGKGND